MPKKSLLSCISSCWSNALIQTSIKCFEWLVMKRIRSTLSITMDPLVRFLLPSICLTHLDRLCAGVYYWPLLSIYSSYITTTDPKSCACLVLPFVDGSQTFWLGDPSPLKPVASHWTLVILRAVNCYLHYWLMTGLQNTALITASSLLMVLHLWASSAVCVMTCLCSGRR